ncbi:hypothetical protein CLF_103142 [Clonorchis sinensis]|uniref:C2H2-type domain-containing protein n=1 Tax=Clonorchis sinensis TaxID=79923 RepID=G7Y952_CLOSI|nr:hypothetical protein CLF_103142 [Clonorchis sinensis]
MKAEKGGSKNIGKASIVHQVFTLKLFNRINNRKQLVLYQDLSPKSVHYKTSGASAPVPISTQERFVGLKCEECGKWCKSKAGLVAHHRVHDNDSVGTNMVAQLACADCSRLFPTKIGLSQHRRHAHPTQHNADKLSRVKHSGARWSQQESQSLLRLANNYGADEFSLAIISALRAVGCDVDLLVHQPMIISYRGICFPQSAKAVIGLGLSKVTVSDLCLLAIVGSPSMDQNSCGRNGCPSDVRHGRQCHTCTAWWNFKRTALRDDQLSQLANSPYPFIRASCPYTKGAMYFTIKKRTTKNKTKYPLLNRKDQCECSVLIGILDTKTGSDVWRQAVKLTDKSAPCVDLDIGECCENPTIAENVKPLISSSTPSKVASWIVDAVSAQDPDSQSHKPDHSGPENPSYTYLATLIAGDSGVHTNTKTGDRNQTNRIRKLLAGFVVQKRAS